MTSLHVSYSLPPPPPPPAQSTIRVTHMRQKRSIDLDTEGH